MAGTATVTRQMGSSYYGPLGAGEQALRAHLSLAAPEVWQDCRDRIEAGEGIAVLAQLAGELLERDGGGVEGENLRQHGGLRCPVLLGGAGDVVALVHGLPR